MHVEQWPIERVIPYDRNPRINEGAVEAVARSLSEFGFRQCLVVDESDVLIVGHTRLKAAQKLGYTHVPVHVAKGLSPEQARAYRIADNQTASIAQWDLDLLPLELKDLEALNFDLSLLGFADDALEKIMNPGGREGLTDPDEIPGAPVEPITQPGDLWLLPGVAEHRLLCGDATHPGDVARLLDGVTPLIMVTDPPYGVEYDPAWRAEAGVNKSKKKLGKVSNDERVDWSAAWRLFGGPVAYVWHADRYASGVQASLEATGLAVRAQIIWAKDRFALSRGDYHWQHEPCWYAVREGEKGHWIGDRKQSTLWTIKAREDGGHGHGTQKPVECMARAIRNHGAPELVGGMSVYDPFVGSGTTIIAAEQLNRRAYAMEIDPLYVDIAVKRWEAFTGRQALRVPASEPAGAPAAPKRPEAARRRPRGRSGQGEPARRPRTGLGRPS